MTIGEAFAPAVAVGPPTHAGEGALVTVVAADVVFILAAALAILQVGPLREREVPLELAGVAEGTPRVHVGARELVIQIGQTGEIRAGGRAVALEELEGRLAEIVGEAGETSVAVRADARADYGLVARVLAAAWRAGVRDASLLTVEERKAPSLLP